MQAKKKVLINPCEENWENMTGDERKRMCAACKENIYDVTHLDLKTLASEYLGSGKCVRMNEGQARYFKFLRSLPKVATLSAALALYPFAYGQDSTDIEMCRVSGRAEESWNANVNIYVVIDGKTYETTTDANGFFALVIPRNKRIEESNVRQLQKRKIRKSHLELKETDLPYNGIIIGSF